MPWKCAHADQSHAEKQKEAEHGAKLPLLCEAHPHAGGQRGGFGAQACPAQADGWKPCFRSSSASSPVKSPSGPIKTQRMF
jgi:hypothetical protein